MNSKKINLVVFGESMLELNKSQPGEMKYAFAGDTLNTAVYLARLLPDQFEVQYVSAIGADHLSVEMLEYWHSEGLSTSYCFPVTNKSLGLYLVSNSANGERSFTYWRNDSAAKYYFQQNESDKLFKHLTDIDLFYFSAISIAILDQDGKDKLYRLLQSVREQGGKVLFDPNYRPALWKNMEQAQQEIDRFGQLANSIFPSLDDEIVLRCNATVASVAQHYLALGIEEVVIKNGSHDGFVYTENSTCKVPLKLNVEAKDTTGAGDSFNAGFIAARANGCDYYEAFVQGNLVAARVVQHQGAIIPKDQF